MQLNSGPVTRGDTNDWWALGRVLFNPVLTYSDWMGKKPVLPGYLLQMLTGLMATAVVLPVTLGVVSDQLAATGATPEAITIGKWSGAIGALVGNMIQPWIAGAIVSLLALLVGQFLGGGVPFRAYFGMIGYARVPLALNTLLGGLLATQAETVEQLAAMSISPAALLSTEANPLLRVVLATLNPFDLWYYVLLAIGFATLHRVKPMKGTALSVTIYILVLSMAVVGTSITKGLGA